MERLPGLQIHLLGSFQVTLAGKPAGRFDSDKTRALLAYLATEPDQAHSRDRLVGRFWPESPERRARASLSQALHNLRTVIRDRQADPPFLTISNDAIQFNRLSRHWLDVSAFLALLSEIEAHHHTTPEDCELCFEKLQAAVSLYRGDFLEGLYFQGLQAFQEWRLFRRERLHRQAVASAKMLAASFEKQGQIEPAQETLHWLLELDPYHENAHQRLMSLSFSQGRTAAALAQYESFRRTLIEELGVEPEPETTELYERIRAAQTGPASAQAKRHNLPEALTTFIGRQDELSQIRQQLAGPDCRLLSILGAGGSGKTRLALEAARAQLEHFTHGVYFVPLNPVQTPQSIPAAIAEALDLPVQTDGDVEQQVINYLRSKNILLLLDGFEHLLAGAVLLSEIMRAASGVKALVTTRSRLNIQGEHILQLYGMSYPEAEVSLAEAEQYSAVQLFITSARRVRPDYAPAEGDLRAIVRICRRVQGMPLGILLASAWMATLDLAEIAAEMERPLDFLSTQWVDVPARHRSLRSTFDHSLSLLTAREREIFQSLAVFRRGFTRLSARQVSQASPHLLRLLGEKSLLQHTLPDRYEIHELLRQYALENLNRSSVASHLAHQRHSQYFCSALERWNEQLHRDQQELALAEMDLEHENVRAAWSWMAENGALDLLARSLEGLCRYYDLRARYREGASACNLAAEKLIQQDVSPQGLTTRAQLCVWESRFKRLAGEYDPTGTLLAECQALLEQAAAAGADTRLEQALVDLEMGNQFFSRDLLVARRYFLRSLALFKELGHAWHITTTLALLGFCSLQRGHFDDAKQWFEQSLTLAQSNGERRSLAAVKSSLGLLRFRQGELEAGFQALQEAETIYQSIGDQASCAAGLRGLGQAHLWLGHYAESIELLSRSLLIFEQLGNLDDVAFMNALLGGTKIHAGFYPEAEPHFSISLCMARENGSRRIIGGSQLLLGWLEMSAGDFARAEEYLQESMTHYRKLKHLDEFGWALATLGYTTYRLGKPQIALKLMREALQTGLKSRACMSVCCALASFAVLVAKHGHPARSLELYAAACQHPLVATSRWFEDVYGRQLQVIAAGLPAELVQAARERGSKRDLWATGAELLAEFQGGISA